MSQPVSLARPDRPSSSTPSSNMSYPPSQQPPYPGAPPAGGQPPYGAPPSGQPGYGAPPGGQPPYGAPPGGQPGGQPPYGAPPGGQPPYGAPPGGQPGQPPYGAPPGGQPGGQPGQPPYGAPPGGQPPYGAPPGGQPPYGAPPGGQPPYGGQPGGQPPYGAPPGGQPPYGAPPGGQPPYGAPPGGQPPYGAPYGQAAMNPATMSVNPGVGGGSVSLVKGQNMNLSKVAPTLRRAMVGLGWDVRQTPGAPFDLDASVFLVDQSNRVQPNNFIFYNNKMSADGSVTHQGDNLTGQGEGDDERILIDLGRVNPAIQRIVFVCTIYEAEVRRQNFGQVSRAFIRVTDADVNREVLRFDLTEDASMFSTMTFGELYRLGGEWKFKALGQGGQGGLRMIGSQFGLQLG